ncbi:MAG: hypothetical protein ACD_77C00341G0001 [uncultured bacterium]|nr:MAG: hypothetical protein ACD_77C00341G0001 [uncultured bacterium]HBY01736.1 DUF58 domain-containing protein [Rikenellaceae bacterium]
MSKELLKKVRKIEIKTRGLSRQIFAGEYHSAFKGRGMAFSEVREYQFGDDVRSMDWNVTARLNAPYIKVFEEERELTVMLLVDVSGSRLFGTTIKTKRELITEIAAVLSFSASANNDKVGALFFSSKVEKFIPPKKGRSHLLRIIRELLEFEPQEKGTDIGEALRYLTNAIKRRCTAFLLSDMIDVDSSLKPRFEEALKIAANRHEIAAISVYDQRERELPDIGLIKIADAESGKEEWVNTSNKSVRDHFNKWNMSVNASIQQTLRRYKVDSVSISTNEDFVKGLVALFKKR